MARYEGVSADRGVLVAELQDRRKQLGAGSARASRAQVAALLTKVNTDADTAASDLGCYWRFCLHVAGIPESSLGHEHRYILPIAGLVQRLGQIATGAAGPGLHLMLCNTQSPPDLGFHWFFVAAQYEAARPAAEPATSHKRPADEAGEEAELEAQQEAAEAATQQASVAGAMPGSGVRPRRSSTIDKARPKTPLPLKLVKREVDEVATRAPVAASAAVRHRPWAPGDRVTVDYQDGVAPYAGTVDSVGATGEVLVVFDDGSSAALKTRAQRARLALQRGVQLLKRRKGAKRLERSP